MPQTIKYHFLQGSTRSIKTSIHEDVFTCAHIHGLRVAAADKKYRIMHQAFVRLHINGFDFFVELFVRSVLLVVPGFCFMARIAFCLAGPRVALDFE